MTDSINDLFKKTQERIESGEKITHKGNEIVMNALNMVLRSGEQFSTSLKSRELPDEERNQLLGEYESQVTEETSKFIDAIFGMEKLTYETEKKIKEFSSSK